jgi:hypothetical protein
MTPKVYGKMAPTPGDDTKERTVDDASAAPTA